MKTIVYTFDLNKIVLPVERCTAMYEKLIQSVVDYKEDNDMYINFDGKDYRPITIDNLTEYRKIAMAYQLNVIAESIIPNWRDPFNSVKFYTCPVCINNDGNPHYNTAIKYDEFPNLLEMQKHAHSFGHALSHESEVESILYSILPHMDLEFQDNYMDLRWFEDNLFAVEFWRNHTDREFCMINGNTGLIKNEMHNLEVHCDIASLYNDLVKMGMLYNNAHSIFKFAELRKNGRFDFSAEDFNKTLEFFIDKDNCASNASNNDSSVSLPETVDLFDDKVSPKFCFDVKTGTIFLMIHNIMAGCEDQNFDINIAFDTNNFDDILYNFEQAIIYHDFKYKSGEFIIERDGDNIKIGLASRGSRIDYFIGVEKMLDGVNHLRKYRRERDFNTEKIVWTKG